MTDDQSRDRLRALARRAETEPFFLASAFKAYVENEGMNEDDLAQFLGCSTEALDPIRLCRRPEGESPDFRRDVQRIAEHFGLRAGNLAQLLRQVDALVTLRGGDANSGTELRAARDRRQEDTDGEAR